MYQESSHQQSPNLARQTVGPSSRRPERRGVHLLAGAMVGALAIGASLVGVGLTAASAVASTRAQITLRVNPAALLTLNEVNHISGLPGSQPPSGNLARYSVRPANFGARRPCGQEPNAYPPLGRAAVEFATRNGSTQLTETILRFPDPTTAGKYVVDAATAVENCPSYPSKSQAGNPLKIQVSNTTPGQGTFSWDSSSTGGTSADNVTHSIYSHQGAYAVLLVSFGHPAATAFNVNPALEAALAKMQTTL